MSRRHNYNTRHKRKNTQPHASYYVGYVEDGETVESIMKKFEVLESIKQKKKEEIQAKENENKTNDEKEDRKVSKKSSKAEITDSEGESDDDGNNNKNKKKDLDMEDENGNVLDEDELAQLFTETSLFSVRSAVNNNEIFMDKPIMDDDGFVTGYDNNVLNSELILAADYKDINDELMEDGDNNGGFEEYDPFEDDDANDPELFFEDIVGKKKKDGSGSARIGGAGGTRRRSSRSTRGGGIRNAPQIAGGGGEGGVNNTELMKDIDKHYAYTYGRHTAPADGDNDAAKKERALKLRTCAAMYCLKIPKYPMPQSWGHRIRRFNGHLESIGTDMERARKELIGYDYIIHNDLKNLKKEDLPHGKYHAILMDAPWDVSCSVFDPRKGLLVPEQLTNLPISDLMENGMLFIWVPSELLVPIVRMIECDWGFRYVEHASYCKRTINNKFCISNSGFMNHSKENLLLFRKGDRKDYAGKLELRHQRTSDTHINFQRFHSKYSKMELKPSEFAYKMIETMLPDSTQQIRDAIKNKSDLSKVESRLLYLWAPEYEKRGGWTMMVDKKHLEYLAKEENQHIVKSNKNKGFNDKQNSKNKNSWNNNNNDDMNDNDDDNNNNNNNNNNNGKTVNGFENDKKENKMGQDSDDDDLMMMM